MQGEGGRYIANSGGEEEVADTELKAEASVTDKPRSMDRNAVAVGGNDELPPEAQLFRYRENMPHMVIILVKEKKIKATQLQAKMGTFIMTYYANSGYKPSPLMFNDSTQMVTISSFNDAREALNFTIHLKTESSPLAEYNSEDYQVYAISKQNYTTLYNRKKVDAYKLFYEKYYEK